MSYEDPTAARLAYEAAALAEYLEGLLGRLRDKVAELTKKGYRILWIEAGPDELVRLFEDGGDAVIELDPDPAIDRAWFQGCELRPVSKQGVFVWLEGEFDQMSCHIV